MKILLGEQWYTPREIARLGLIKNSTGGEKLNSNHIFVLKLIHSGQLRAKNFGIGAKRPAWLVPASAIKLYHNTLTKV